MVPECARKEDGQDTPQPRKPNPQLWQGIGTLAFRLGFESKEIHRLRRTNPDEGIARGALLTARDPRRYKYPDGLLEDLVKQITEKFETAIELRTRTKCIFCFGNPREPYEVRLHHFSTVYKARDHVKLHLKQFKTYDDIPCLDPDCQEAVVVLGGHLHFMNHAALVHDYDIFRKSTNHIPVGSYCMPDEPVSVILRRPAGRTPGPAHPQALLKH
jgi:Protein of unknown function (DUF3723)